MYHPPFFVCTPVFLLESFPTGCGPNSSEENALQCSILTTVLLYAEPRLDYYFPFASSEFISFAFHCTKMTPHKALNSQSWTKKIIWADFKILFSWFRLFLPNAFGWVNLPTGDVSTNYFCVIENFGLLALETLYFLDFRYAQSNLDSDLPFPLGDDLESLQITEWPREKTNYSKKRQASFIFKLEFLISRLFFPLFSFSPARIKFTTLLI